jgi:26S proteasome regulatory subunit N7
MGEPQFAKFPDLQLSQHIFQITNPSSSKAVQNASLRALQTAIEERQMAPLYRYLAHPTEGIVNLLLSESTSSLPHGPPRRTSSNATNILATRRPSLAVSLPWDEELYEKLAKENEKELEIIQKEEDDATEKAGETEIQTARGKRAEFWTRVGDKVWLFNFSLSVETHFYVRTKLSRRTKQFSRKRVSWERR